MNDIPLEADCDLGPTYCDNPEGTKGMWHLVKCEI